LVLNEQIKSYGNNKNLKLGRSWRHLATEEKKRSWRNSAPEVSCSWRIVLLKTRGPEATSSEAASSEAAEVISSEAASSEAASSEAISPEAEYQLDLQRIKNWRIINAKAVYWIRKHKQRISGVCNGHFKGVWRRVFAIWTKALTLYFVRIVQPRSPLLCFVSALQDKKTAPEYGFACIDVPLDKEWISNLFFIGQQPNQAKDYWWKIKLQQRLFGVLAISQRLSHTSI
jgi:hypothetical protein